MLTIYFYILLQILIKKIKPLLEITKYSNEGNFYLRSLPNNQFLFGLKNKTYCYIIYDINENQNTAQFSNNSNCDIIELRSVTNPIVDYINDNIIFLYSTKYSTNDNKLRIRKINDTTYNLDRDDIFSKVVSLISFSNYTVLAISKDNDGKMQFTFFDFHDINNPILNTKTFASAFGVSGNVTAALKLKNNQIFISEYTMSGNHQVSFSFLTVFNNDYNDIDYSGQTSSITIKERIYLENELISFELDDPETNLPYIIQCYRISGKNNLTCYSGYYQNSKFYYTIQLKEIHNSCITGNYAFGHKISSTVAFVGCRTLDGFKISRIGARLNIQGKPFQTLDFNYYPFAYIPFSDYKILFVNDSSNEYLFNIRTFPCCPDKTNVTVKKNQILKFSDLITDFTQIKIVTLPEKGSICNLTSLPDISICKQSEIKPSFLYNQYEISNLFFVYDGNSISVTFTFMTYVDKLESEICIGQIDICYETCDTCSSLGTENNNLCIECLDDNYYWLNSENSGNCVNKNNPGYYIISDEKKIVNKCYESCAACEIGGNSVKHNCEECIDNYYKYIKGDKLNCYHKNDIIDYIYADSSSQSFLNCINGCITCSENSNSDSLYKCKVCDTKNGFYPLYKNDLLNEEKICVCLTLEQLKEDQYKQYYFDEENKEIKRCYETCDSCSKGGNEQINNCISCKEQFLLINSNCICQNQDYYYINDNNEFICAPNCPNDKLYIKRDILYFGKCVNECLNEPIYNNICEIKCPNGTITDNNNCFDLDVCAKNEYISRIKYEFLNKDILISMARNYLEEFRTTEKNIKIIRNIDNEYDIILFKNTECLLSSMYNDLIKVDLESCIETIKEINFLSKDYPLVIILLNIYRGKNYNPQSEYAFYNEELNTFYSLDSCLTMKSTIIVPLKNFDLINKEAANNFFKKGINIYDKNDTFFTSLCFQYTDENGNDVTLIDRFNDYYQNVNYCDDDCEVSGYNLNFSEVNCSCNIKETLNFNIIYNKENIKERKTEGLTIFDISKCYKETMKNLKNNPGSYIIITITIIQIIFTFLYFKDGLNGMKSFLLLFMANPPKIFGTNSFNRNNMNQVTNPSLKNDFQNFKEEINKKKKDIKYDINLEGKFKNINSSFDNNQLYYHNYLKYYIDDLEDKHNYNNEYNDNIKKNKNKQKEININNLQKGKKLDNDYKYNNNLNNNDFNQNTPYENIINNDNNVNIFNNVNNSNLKKSDNEDESANLNNKISTFKSRNKKEKKKTNKTQNHNNDLIKTKNENDNNNNDLIEIKNENDNNKTEIISKDLPNTDYFENRIIQNNLNFKFTSNKKSFNSNELIVQNISARQNDNDIYSDLNDINREKIFKYKIGYYGNNMSSDRNSFSILRVNKNKNWKKYKTYIIEDKEAINIDGIKLNEDINKIFIRNTIKDEDTYLNELDYFKAKKYDKRTFCQFYKQQIIHRQGILYLFLKYSPIEPISIKIIIFLFQLTLCLITNCMFYSKRYISKKHYKGEKNDISHILKNGWIRIFLSTLLTLFIIFVMGFLYIPQKNIVKIIRKEKDKNIKQLECAETFQKMKLINLIFLIVNFVLMILFWIFLSLFCYVYINTIIDWIFGSFITWILIQIFPFFGVLIVTCLRFIGLKFGSECSFKISICFTI